MMIEKYWNDSAVGMKFWNIQTKAAGIEVMA